ncbi:MAG: carbamoyltransferase HypF, partial [Spirochaetales bacterium]|nr:carbamoyltransferase HypF [Spirochaetales bacterium]
MNSDQQHICLQLCGRIQGVGFRPFVSQLATKLSLKGTVCNTANGVTIHLLGLAENLLSFEQQLNHQKPIHASIQSISKQTLPITDYDGFQIIESRIDSHMVQTSQIPPDIATCQACLAEFNDPDNRRYLDPFINCSDCGPRFTIMRQLPYDRHHSAMQTFELCNHCRSEYTNPLGRRYHSQGICCPQCGPKIRLYSANQELLSEDQKAIQQVADCLKQAGLVAFKGVGGFHVLCDANNELAVAKLRRRKLRAHKPLAVLCKDLAMAKGLANLCQHEEALLTSYAQPIVLVDKRTQQGQTELSDLVAPDTNRLGLMLAYTPLQHLLFQFFEQPLVATSANLSGEPILYQAEELFTKLCRPGFEVVDLILDFDREIFNPCDDSVVQSVGQNKQQTLRLARGLAPLYGALPAPVVRSCMAVGAQQKSTIAFAQESQWCLSPYIGDLHSLAFLQRFQQTIERISELTSFEPEELVCDLHPSYASSVWAEKEAVHQAMLLDRVQHHYAHVLACMAEFNLHQQVLAFSWDGSGLGDDGTLWGGVLLLADLSSYRRLFYLKPFKLLGGDLANQQPRRIALSLLFAEMSFAEVLVLDSPSVQAFSQAEIEQLHQMYQQNLNSPLSSSVGRLFDAVASLLGLLQTLDYEGQSGLLLEALYDDQIVDAYDFAIINNQIEIQPMLNQLLRQQQQKIEPSVIVSRVFNMLVNLIEQLADQYADLAV